VEAPEAVDEDLGILVEAEGVKRPRRRVTVPTLAVKRPPKAKNLMSSRANLLSPSEVVAAAVEGLSGPVTSVEAVAVAGSTSTLTKTVVATAKLRMVTTMKAPEAVEVEVAAAVEAVVAEVSEAVVVSEAATVVALEVSVAVHAVVVAVEAVAAVAEVVASVAVVAAKAALKTSTQGASKGHYTPSMLVDEDLCLQLPLQNICFHQQKNDFRWVFSRP